MMLIADTDVLIDYLRGAGEADRVALELKAGSLSTTVISAFELWSGAKSEKQVRAVNILLAAMAIVPLTAAAASAAAGVRRVLERRRETIGMADSLIAGICLDEQAILLTRNKKHFERVDGLRISGKYD